MDLLVNSVNLDTNWTVVRIVLKLMILTVLERIQMVLVYFVMMIDYQFMENVMILLKNVMLMIVSIVSELMDLMKIVTCVRKD